MPQHTNFYENLEEAQMRLRSTIVLYDKVPYLVLAITNEKNDGIFRVYLEPFYEDGELRTGQLFGDFPLNEFPPTYPGVGTKLDTWMEAHPGSKILRKQMNSPLFNKFRPFPLGMCNYNGKCYYLERQPIRKSEQGLTSGMLTETLVSLFPSQAPRRSVDIMAPAFRDCILGAYPPASACLDAMKDSNVINDAVGFHRDFAIVRGPIKMLFLAYKGNVVGVLPNNDFSLLRIGEKFLHTKEVIQQLNLFSAINVG